MEQQATVLELNPSSLAALVYTESVTMHPESFCGLFDRTPSMSRGKSAFCSYDMNLVVAGCCAIEEPLSRIIACPFQPTCIDHENLPLGMSSPYTNWDPKEGLSW